MVKGGAVVIAGKKFSPEMVYEAAVEANNTGGEIVLSRGGPGSGQIDPEVMAEIQRPGRLGRLATAVVDGVTDGLEMGLRFGVAKVTEMIVGTKLVEVAQDISHRHQVRTAANEVAFQGLKSRMIAEAADKREKKWLARHSGDGEVIDIKSSTK